MPVSRGELRSRRCYRSKIDTQQLRSNHYRNDQGTGGENSRTAYYSRNEDIMISKKTTYWYGDGKKFAMFTFKNDELVSKEGNLQREP